MRREIIKLKDNDTVDILGNVIYPRDVLFIKLTLYDKKGIPQQESYCDFVPKKSDGTASATIGMLSRYGAPSLVKIETVQYAYEEHGGLLCAIRDYFVEPLYYSPQVAISLLLRESTIRHGIDKLDIDIAAYDVMYDTFTNPAKKRLFDNKGQMLWEVYGNHRSYATYQENGQLLSMEVYSTDDNGRPIKKISLHDRNGHLTRFVDTDPENNSIQKSISHLIHENGIYRFEEYPDNNLIEVMKYHFYDGKPHLTYKDIVHYEPSWRPGKFLMWVERERYIYGKGHQLERITKYRIANDNLPQANLYVYQAHFCGIGYSKKGKEGWSICGYGIDNYDIVKYSRSKFSGPLINDNEILYTKTTKLVPKYKETVEQSVYLDGCTIKYIETEDDNGISTIPYHYEIEITDIASADYDYVDYLQVIMLRLATPVTRRKKPSGCAGYIIKNGNFKLKASCGKCEKISYSYTSGEKNSVSHQFVCDRKELWYLRESKRSTLEVRILSNNIIMEALLKYAINDVIRRNKYSREEAKKWRNIINTVVEHR